MKRSCGRDIGKNHRIKGARHESRRQEGAGVRARRQRRQNPFAGRLQGKTVVLYFYPKDDTPGCTKEACGFRDLNAGIKKTGAVVLGVSKDGAESHRKFSAKYKLPFVLL